MRVDRLGRADPGDDVLALRVDEELAEGSRSPVDGSRVKQTPVPGRLALVAEHHLDDVDRRAEVVRDLVRRAGRPARAASPTSRRRRGRAARAAPARPAGTARRPRARRSPGTSRSSSRRSSAVSSTSCVHAPLLLQRLSSPSKRCAVDPVDDLAVHLDQPPVRVVGEARVAGRRGEPLDRLVVQAEVEDRVHHPRHRDRGARADRDEQRVGRVAEALAGALLEPRDVLVDLVVEALGHLAAAAMYARQASVVIVKPAGTGTPSAVISARPIALAAEELAPAPELLVEAVDVAHGAILCTGDTLARLAVKAFTSYLVGERLRQDDRRRGSNLCRGARTSSSTRSTIKWAGASSKPTSSAPGRADRRADEWVIDGTYRGQARRLPRPRGPQSSGSDLARVSGSPPPAGSADEAREPDHAGADRARRSCPPPRRRDRRACRGNRRRSPMPRPRRSARPAPQLVCVALASSRPVVHRVELDERHPEPLGEAPPDRRLAAPARRGDDRNLCTAIF